MSALRRATAPPLVCALIAAVVACAAPKPDKAGPCDNNSYASGGAHSVVCPGVVGCSCGAPNACCMTSIDAHAGSCIDPRTCSGLILSCDGPEDCNGGVCCLSSTGSSCAPAGECQGQWLCRGDGECAGSPGGPSCNPADFGYQGVKDRGLDGLIGICGQG